MRSAQAALPPVSVLPHWLRADLRSDHAGETGAVYFYRGVLDVATDPAVRDFAEEHLAQESEHLALFEAWLAPVDKSVFLPLWRFAGWLLGIIAGLAGDRAVYITVDAIEEFVVEHYSKQIERLAHDDDWPEVQLLLTRFCEDEFRHRQEAQNLWDERTGIIASTWRLIVGAGSAVAVLLARAY